MENNYEIIEDCPNFINKCCQEYLDGDCSSHKCDLKVIKELEQKILELESMNQSLRNQFNFTLKNLMKVIQDQYDYIDTYRETIDKINELNQNKN